MKRSRLIAVAGAPVALAALLATPALAGAAKVSFRVEGASRTLLPARTVTVPSRGSITKAGAPKGTCPANSAAGALNVATRGRWNGTDSQKYGIEVTNILGETTRNTKVRFWELFVDNHPASLGICDQKVSSGDQLLFADVSTTGHPEFPIVISAPRSATAGSPFQVRASYYPTSSSKAKPLAGVSFTGVTGKTNVQGVATVTANTAGKLSLVGSKPGEIRSAAATVVVSK